MRYIFSVNLKLQTQGSLIIDARMSKVELSCEEDYFSAKAKTWRVFHLTRI
jgi:hypothetical protein